MQKQKQLFQVQNILETLIEATDHFSRLIKDKEINQSIYMFSSIVEGSQAITNMLLEENKTFTKDMQTLEQYLLLIAKEMEEGRLTKVSEVIQFSLRPLFVRLLDTFTEDIGDFKKEKTISIGIFHSFVNPREFYPEERLQATLFEGEKQNTSLYFFTSEDIDFKNEQIEADTFKNNTWVRGTVPFPDVINNVGAGKRSQAERRLQRIIPFTGFHVGNKYTLPKRMLKHRKYAELLVPFTVCLHENRIYQFIEDNNHVVFKALKSNRGENIYFANKKGSRYIILDQKKERILSEEEFHSFVTNTILAEKGSFIIQRYIHTRTKNDEPYHFRSHVQKDGNGEWQVTHIYPRIGNIKSNLSNIATEGRVEDFPLFLQNEFGEKKGSDYEHKILQLSIEVTKHLDKIYGMGLNELGLDFAIDDTGKIWMHEANNGPQTAYHEKKRAINFIAYAKYIAENGLMRTNHSSQHKGQFQARKSTLSVAKVPFDKTIGMLVGQHTNDTLSLTLARLAAKSGMPFFSFTPMDIDYDLGLIRGSFYEQDTWVQKVVEYPSVIIDRLKMRRLAEDIVMYEELEDIPFTNEWIIDAVNRSKIYETLHKHEVITNSMPDFQQVRRPLHVFQFIEKYGCVLLQQEEISVQNSTFLIKELESQTYEVIVADKVRHYSRNELRNFINHRIEDRQYLVQDYSFTSKDIQMIYATTLKIHGDWTNVYEYVHTVTIHDSNITVSKKNTEDFGWSDESIKLLKKNMNDLIIGTASILEKELNNPLSEAEFVFSIQPNREFRLMDVNPNGPTTVENMNEYATALLSQAQSIQ